MCQNYSFFMLIGKIMEKMKIFYQIKFIGLVFTLYLHRVFKLVCSVQLYLVSQQKDVLNSTTHRLKTEKRSIFVLQLLVKFEVKKSSVVVFHLKLPFEKKVALKSSKAESIKVARPRQRRISTTATHLEEVTVQLNSQRRRRARARMLLSARCVRAILAKRPRHLGKNFDDLSSSIFLFFSRVELCIWVGLIFLNALIFLQSFVSNSSCEYIFFILILIERYEF